MARQPLLPVYSNATCRLGPNYIESRPALATIIGNCMAYWPEVLHQQGLLLSLLLGVRSPGTAAMFATLQNARARRDAINAAAKHGLSSEKEFDLVTAVMNIVSAAEKERNDLAHGCYGISEEIPDGVLWIDSQDNDVWATEVVFKPSGKPSREDYTRLAQLLFVYKAADLQRIYEQMQEAWSIIHHLIRYIDERQRAAGTLSPSADGLYDLLVAVPLVAEALRRIAEAREKKSLPQQSLQSDYYGQ